VNFVILLTMSGIENWLLEFIKSAYQATAVARRHCFDGDWSACIPITQWNNMPWQAGCWSKIRGSYRVNLLAGVMGALGCTIGSLAAYWVGTKGGRPFLNKYGKYVLIHHMTSTKPTNGFKKNGDWRSSFPGWCPWSELLSVCPPVSGKCAGRNNLHCVNYPTSFGVISGLFLYSWLPAAPSSCFV